MPTNLPPQYFDVEKELKTTNDPHEKIAIMENCFPLFQNTKEPKNFRLYTKQK